MSHIDIFYHGLIAYINILCKDCPILKENEVKPLYERIFKRNNLTAPNKIAPLKIAYQNSNLKTKIDSIVNDIKQKLDGAPVSKGKVMLLYLYTKDSNDIITLFETFIKQLDGITTNTENLDPFHIFFSKDNKQEKRKAKFIQICDEVFKKTDATRADDILSVLKNVENKQLSYEEKKLLGFINEESSGGHRRRLTKKSKKKKKAKRRVKTQKQKKRP